jgi:nitrogen fixation NifU-like protein
VKGEPDDLYQELILDHQKSPRNFGDLPGANRNAEGHNPICGDSISLHLKVDDGGVIEDVKFTGKGCAISRASASLMTLSVKGRTVAEAGEQFARFHALLIGEGGPGDAAELGKLLVFSGVRNYPARVKCASLAWHTLKAALEGGAARTVTTEEGG